MIDRKRLLVMIFVMTGCASKNIKMSDSLCQHSSSTLRCVEYIRNYDGDTITFNIPRLHPLIGQGISVRVRGIDTAEVRTRDLCEKEKALRAKKIVEKILLRSNKIDLYHVKRGKYFRLVADVIVDGKSIGKELINSNLAYPYFGNTKKEVNWCFKDRQ